MCVCVCVCVVVGDKQLSKALMKFDYCKLFICINFYL